jgi:putative ABC transport system permease protein
MMRALTIALRSLSREWRHGELAVLLVTLGVAVAALTGVGFLVDRIERAINAQASEVLAADLRVEAPVVLDAADETQARALGLQTARLTALLSAVFNGDSNQLANIRAVTSGYPLRGNLTVAAAAFASGAATRDVPARGEAWADSRLASALGVAVGGQLTVGASTLRLTRIVISRPDQGSGFVDFAATLLINEFDLAATQLIQPASRVRYALLLSGERAQLDAFRRWHQTKATPRERLQDIEDGSPQIGSAVRRAGRFLGLAGLVAVLLCAVAVAMTARSYVRKHLDVVALMKTLGATRAFVLTVSVIQLLCLALAATAIGSVLGWLTQHWLVRVLKDVLRSNLPPASFGPVVIGLVVAVTMLAGFALPSLLQLTRTPALRVLRRDVAPPPPGAVAAGLPALIAIVAVVYGTLGEWRMSLWFVGGLAAAVALLTLAGALLVALAAHLRHGPGVAWRHGIASLARRRSASIVQIVGFGIGVMLLLILATLRRDLVSNWKATFPPNPPNYFFVNIPAAEQTAFGAKLTGLGAHLERMLPMVRGRLMSINNVPVASMRFGNGPPGGDAGPRDGARGGGARGGGPRGGGLAEREQNLTWTSELGDDNRIVAGRWWTPADAGKSLVSLATEFQEQLNLKLGDQLAFDIAGESIVVTVASFRSVKWDTFRPNFFIVFPPGLLDGAAGTYMTSAVFEPRKPGDMAELVQRFPSVSVFNVGDLLAQVRSVIDKAVTAVQSVFLFTLLAGLTVLLAAVQASRDERRHETAVLRVLGAKRATIVKSVLTEFAALGLVAGLLAASCAAVAGYWAASTLELSYRFNALAWIAGVVLTVVIVALGGWLATRSALNQSPRSVLGSSPG